MKKINNNQAGVISIWLVFLIVIIIAVLGYAGMTVWQNNQSKNSKTNIMLDSDIQAPNDSNVSENYLEVEQWKVKFKLDDSVKDASYIYSSDGYITLTTPRLNELAANNSDCSGANESITIKRAKIGEDNFGTPWTEEELIDRGIKVGEYYYYSEAGQPCFREGGPEEFNAVEQEVMSIRAMLSEIYNSVTPL